MMMEIKWESLTFEKWQNKPKYINELFATDYTETFGIKTLKIYSSGLWMYI